MDTSLTSIQQHLRKLEQLVTSDGMTAEELHRLELELRRIIDRIDAIRALARDLRHKPELSAEDTKGLDALEEALKVSLKKDVGD
jgi:hypothetical protein